MISKSTTKQLSIVAQRAEKRAKQLPDAELKRLIEGISSSLLGYGIPAHERLCLNEERKAFRAELASRVKA